MIGDSTDSEHLIKKKSLAENLQVASSPIDELLNVAINDWDKITTKA